MSPAAKCRLACLPLGVRVAPCGPVLSLLCWAHPCLSWSSSLGHLPGRTRRTWLHLPPLPGSRAPCAGRDPERGILLGPGTPGLQAGLPSSSCPALCPALGLSRARVVQAPAVVAMQPRGSLHGAPQTLRRSPGLHPVPTSQMLTLVLRLIWGFMSQLLRSPMWEGSMFGTSAPSFPL